MVRDEKSNLKLSIDSTPHIPTYIPLDKQCRDKQRDLQRDLGKTWRYMSKHIECM